MATHSGILAWRIPWGHKFLDVQFFALISSLIVLWLVNTMGFPGGSVGKESACNAGDLGLIPRLGRSPGEGNGYSLQYSGFPDSFVGKQSTCSAGDLG